MDDEKRVSNQCYLLALAPKKVVPALTTPEKVAPAHTNCSKKLPLHHINKISIPMRRFLTNQTMNIRLKTRE
jgi:hypothetical protein